MQTPDHCDGQDQNVEIGDHVENARNSGVDPFSELEIRLNFGASGTECLRGGVEPNAGEVESGLNSDAKVDEVSHCFVAAEETVIK